MERVAWSSRLGFIMAAAGSAIGLGAIWKFPYITAQNGGGIFLLLYLLIVFTMGVTVMIAEMAVGQISQKSPVGAYRSFGGKAWSSVGYVGVLCGFLILSFYSVVGGWTIFYFVMSVHGSVITSDAVKLRLIFETFVKSPFDPLWFHGTFLALTAAVVLTGVQKGIERVCKVLMTLFFLLILVLIFRSLTLPGASEGLMYFLMPDFGKVSTRMALEALGLAFFSLSLGMGCMLTYGSYVSDDTNIVSSALSVVGLTVLSCTMSGLMILPAVFSIGLDPAEGPGLSFITMPAVFAHMGGAQFFAVMFFFLLFVAAITSAVSLMEVVVSFLIDEFAVTRTRAVVLMTALIFSLGVAASLSLGIWGGYTLFGKNLFELLDYVTCHIMMPFGGVMISLLVGWKIWEPFSKRLSPTGGASPQWFWLFRFFCRYIAPFLILLVLI